MFGQLIIIIHYARYCRKRFNLNLYIESDNRDYEKFFLQNDEYVFKIYLNPWICTLFVSISSLQHQKFYIKRQYGNNWHLVKYDNHSWNILLRFETELKVEIRRKNSCALVFFLNIFEIVGEKLNMSWRENVKEIQVKNMLD